LIASGVLNGCGETQTPLDHAANAERWVTSEFTPSTLSRAQQLEEMAWFTEAALPFRGAEISVVSETLTTHEYESEILTRAFYEITGIRVTHDLIQEGAVTVVDIRDPDSFEMGHLENAQQVTDDDVEEFIRSSDFSQPLLVYCYHGISSQSAADYFGEQGFQDVYHLAGGFEAWRSSGLPTHSN
jgi:rhodanese-related sulfurtransferase